MFLKNNLPLYDANISFTLHFLVTCIFSHFGSVMVSVLATIYKVPGFKPNHGNGFLRAIKIHGIPML
jgi:hypothetical protein